ncbi:MAG: beta-lactamase family protein [Bacteroidia bacterium]
MAFDRSYISKTIAKVHPAPAYHHIYFNKDSIVSHEFSGLSDITSHVLLNEQTSFHALSITKTFTAVGIMHLFERGLVNLDNPIYQYLPEYAFSHEISVRQLLCHQSGLANPIPLRWIHQIKDHSSFDQRSFADNLIKKNLTLKQKPGRRYSYSNLNYLVLGRLIETITQKNYQTFINESILSKLPSDNYIGFEIPDSNHATGYHSNTWFQNIVLSLLMGGKRSMQEANDVWKSFNPFYVNGVAYGGLLASPKAMMHYCQTLFDEGNVLLSQHVIKEMLSVQSTSQGKTTHMALGWFRGELNNKEYFCHAGGGGGYYSEVRVYPALRTGSIVMLNSSGMRDIRLLDHLDLQLIK